MATSLKSLRQGLGLDLAECTVATVSSGSATTITADALVDHDASSSRYDRAWLKVTSGNAAGSVRRIRETDKDEIVKGFDPENGILQWSRELSDAPSAGDEFEIHQLLDPDRMDTLINRALQRCTYLEQENITVVSGRPEYSLAAYAWLTRTPQVQQVYWRYGERVRLTDTSIAFAETIAGAPGEITDTKNNLASFKTGDAIVVSGSASNDGTYTVSIGGVAGTIRTTEETNFEAAGATVTITGVGQYRYRPMRWWRVSEDAGALTLHIRPLAAEGDTIVLEGIGPYEALSGDDEETDCPAEWVRTMARWEIYNWLVQTGPAQDVSRYEERRAEAYRDARRLYKLHAPRPRPRIQQPDTPARGYSSSVAH